LNITKIETLGTGAIYCQLLDYVHPGKVPINKLNWKAKFEHEIRNNYKILKKAFDNLGINKIIDENKLVKCKYQDNLEFI
jgi:RP/EB family microtubule-associated protein